MATSKNTITILKKILDLLLPLDMIPLQTCLQFRHSKFVSLLTILFFWTGLGAERTTELDTFVRIARESKNHELLCQETFHGDTPYRFFRSVSHIQAISFPDTIPDREEYQKESQELSMVYPPGLKSMEIHTSLDNPVREKIVLQPQVPKSFRHGIPVKLSVWVYSNYYAGNLYLRFKTPKNGDVKVDMGSLLYSGWRRLEAKFPYTHSPVGPKSPGLLTFHFKSIELQFQKTQAPGPVVLRFHRLGVLLEKHSEYPGSEIYDDWRFK